MYECKVCGRPVEQAIEGELICRADWARGQMSDDEKKINDEIEHSMTHCSDCNKKLRSAAEKANLRCAPCEKKLCLEMEADLFGSVDEETGESY